MLGIDGKTVTSSTELTRLVGEHHTGEVMHLQVLRTGRPLVVDVRSGVRPSEQELSKTDKDNDEDQGGAAPAVPAAPRPSALGMTFGPLDEQARRRYSIPADVRGVVVESVKSTSDAGDKGLKRGDVIVRIYDKAATSPADILSAVAEAKKAGRASVLLQIHRNGRNIFVPIKLEP